MFNTIKHLITLCVIGLSTIFSSNILAEQFQLETLTISDGLPSSSITTMYQQRNGLIWFGTDAGASRYDGVKFTNFQFSVNDETHISNNYISKIHEDSQGNIWIATEDGLNQLTTDNQIIIHNMISTNKTMSSSWILQIFESDNGDLWFGTGSGISKFSPITQQFTPFFLYEDDEPYETSVSGIFADDDDTIWATTDFGIAKVNQDNQKIELVNFKHKQTNDILSKSLGFAYKAENGDVWITSNKQGLIKFNPQTLTIEVFNFDKNNPSKQQLLSNLVYDIAFKDNNTLWVAHDAGVTRILLDTMEFTHLAHEAFNNNSLPSDYIPFIMVDHSNGVWFGTGNGAALYSNFKQGTKLYRPHPFNSELSGSLVYWFNFDNQNNTWITSNKGIDRLPFNNEKIALSPIANLEIKNTYSATSDKDNNLWIAGDNGLSQYNIDTGDLKHFSNGENNPSGFPNSEFYLAVPDDQGNVWINGYFDVGLIQFNPQKGIIKHLLTDNDNLYRAGGNFTFDQQFIHNGELWMATTNAIFRVNPDTYEVKHFPLGNEAQNVRTVKIYQDENNIIWVATQGLGLAKIEMGERWADPISIEYITKEDGLTSNTLKGVTGDGKGNLWITSQSKFAKMDTATNKIVQYPSAINQIDSSFTDAAIAFKDDVLFLGTNNGAFRIDTNKIISNRFQPEVLITSALIANQEYIGLNNNQQKSALTLDYEQNNVHFSFASLDFSAPRKNQYRYMLEGFDNDWVYIGNNTSASYTNLHVGTYRFIVQGSNSDGHWSPHNATFSFKINQAWWYYAIASLIVICVLLMFLFLLTRYQKITELSKRANYDVLTGLSNRFRFNSKLELIVNQKEDRAAVVFIDLDYFKEVNDSMGHDVGDELIIQVSKRLKSNLKNKDLLARLGGDEFAIIISEPGELSQLVNIIERIRLTINTGYQIKEHWITSSASIGVACFPEDGEDSKTLLKHADTAMYAAKHAGRNGAYFFNESLSIALQAKITIRQQLQLALINDEFEVFYQPKVCLNSGKISSFEALLRWFHPTEGMIPPARFIPEAESNGQIIEIGYWVLKQTCITAQQWHIQGLLAGNISVNISPVQLSQPDICEQIKAILDDTGFPAEKLELEITESLLIENFETAEKVLNQLNELNIRISLDDFGKGYSSLNYLTHFPLSTLKIDKGFIDNFLDNKAARCVLKNIINLGNDLEMQIVAEGIETELQLMKLIQYQCHVGQGYIFSPAVNKDTAYQMLTGTIKLLPQSMKNKVS
ncbi:EAL domain-containing protein [Shewanella donghaensis]|uniref:EAL domain-containing protein n=1 Tax=Shewanella donghaensis TaxID=238836 RepID=UPI00118320A9|nr:EAL domain-containing protein [Shewanella donghaensis]